MYVIWYSVKGKNNFSAHFSFTLLLLYVHDALTNTQENWKVYIQLSIKKWRELFLKYEKQTFVLFNGCTFRSNWMCHISECKTTTNESLIQMKCLFDGLYIKGNMWKIILCRMSEPLSTCRVTELYGSLGIFFMFRTSELFNETFAIDVLRLNKMIR